MNRKIIVAACAAASILAPTLGVAETITLRADTWCPFNCDPKSPLPGYLVEIAKAALEPSGNTIEYTTLNWARAITETRDGKFSGIVGAAKSDAPDFIFPTVSLGKAANCFYAKPEGTWSYSGADSLNTIVFGAVKDYTYGEPIDSYIKKNAKDTKKVDIVAGDGPLDLNIKKLQLGRIGAVIESEFVFQNYLFSKKLPETAFKKVGCLAEADDLFVAFGPKTTKGPEYAKLISSKIEAMRKDGSLKSLLAKYGVTDWSK